jgi:hypothetical protein
MSVQQEDETAKSEIKRRYTSMGASDFRSGWPEWMRQLPIQHPTPDPNYQLIKYEELDRILRTVESGVAEVIRKDVGVLEKNLMSLFRERDFTAKQAQNRYRLHQLRFALLCVLTTLLGGLQAAFVDSANFLSLIGFFTLILTLLALFFVTVQAPFRLWQLNRRRAEYLRQEYIRYITNQPPYNNLGESERRRKLAQRAADINRGIAPQNLE